MKTPDIHVPASFLPIVLDAHADDIVAVTIRNPLTGAHVQFVADHRIPEQRQPHDTERPPHKCQACPSLLAEVAERGEG